MNVVRAARGGDVNGGICGAAAELVLAVGADAEVCGVAIEPRFEAGADQVVAGGVGNSLAALEEISVGLHDRSGGGVKGFEEAVVELDRGICVVGGGEAAAWYE